MPKNLRLLSKKVGRGLEGGAFFVGNDNLVLVLDSQQSGPSSKKKEKGVTFIYILHTCT